MTWQEHDFGELARELLGNLPARRRHVVRVAQTVAATCHEPVSRFRLLGAAWLHDIGYARPLHRTGMHAIDGAMYLDLIGVPTDIVSLVAFHSGAAYEAEERGLSDVLLRFSEPAQDDMDLLILADMTSSPEGKPVPVSDRLAGIFERYEPQHPVHRAIRRAQPYLQQCCRRASATTGYPM